MFKSTRALGLMIALQLAPLAATPARALDDADRSAIRAMISAQLDAFKRGDAEGAYRFASPGVAGKFPSATEFLDMVRGSYAPLFHEESADFADLAETDAGTVQKVLIKDSDGVLWTALYVVERVDGQWRISGCLMSRASGDAT